MRVLVSGSYMDVQCTANQELLVKFCIVPFAVIEGENRRDFTGPLDAPVVSVSFGAITWLALFKPRAVS
jgi:hypothetical protein